MIGRKFGRWNVLKRAPRGDAKSRSPIWMCRCDCGNYGDVQGGQLRAGLSRSCGCLAREIARVTCLHRRTHGRSGTLTFRRWFQMLRRCENPRASGFKYYGARGVRVCKRWHRFANFLSDMGECPRPSLSLDRKDSRRDYTPRNCRWADRETQHNNTRKTRWITMGGVRLSMKQWAIRQGLNYHTVWRRFEMGWSVRRALTTPVKKRRK